METPEQVFKAILKGRVIPIDHDPYKRIDHALTLVEALQEKIPSLAWSFGRGQTTKSAYESVFYFHSAHFRKSRHDDPCEAITRSVLYVLEGGYGTRKALGFD